VFNQQKCTVEDKNQLVNAVDIIELRARRIVLQTGSRKYQRARVSYLIRALKFRASANSSMSNTR